MPDTRIKPETPYGQLEASLPFAPGNTFNIDKNLPNQRKSHAFDYQSGVAVFKGNAVGIGGEKLEGQDLDISKVPSASIASVRQSQTSPQQKHQQTQEGTLSQKPAWVEFDKKVLRFYAFEQIDMKDNIEESVKIRKFNVYFYLEDDSIHVSEPRTANSGTPQGTFIRRHVIPRHDDPNKTLKVDDLNVGTDLVLYARVFHLTGCDKFTREYLTSIGKTVPEDSTQPIGQYEIKRKELADRMKPGRAYAPNHSLAQFLAHDRQVLRFSCVWDDSSSHFGDVRLFELRYFLCDDTVEVSEKTDRNSGRSATGKMFLKKSKLPKNQAASAPGGNKFLGGSDGSTAEGKEEFYTDRDLSVGGVVQCWGRPFILLDCDAFTREYYKENYGVQRIDALTVDQVLHKDPETGASKTSQK